MAWRFGGVDPAGMVWPEGAAVVPVAPEPWPSRVEAFLTACAMHAGQRERDLMSIVEGISQGLSDAKR